MKAAINTKIREHFMHNWNPQRKQLRVEWKQRQALIRGLGSGLEEAETTADSGTLPWKRGLRGSFQSAGHGDCSPGRRPVWPVWGPLPRWRSGLWLERRRRVLERREPRGGSPKAHIKFPSEPRGTFLGLVDMQEPRGEEHLEAGRVGQRLLLLSLQGSRAWSTSSQ